MIGMLVGGLLGIGKDWLGHKQEIKKIDRQAAIARKQAEAEAAGKMDAHSRDNITWEDNYIILLFTMPLILLFSAPLLALFYPEANQITPAVMVGFAALEETPKAYQNAMGLIFIYVFGFRRLFHKLIDSRLGKSWKGG